MIATIDLARFIGWRARLWDFSPSHDRLVLRLTHPASGEEYIVISGCEEINAPVFWVVADPEVTNDECVHFTDEGVRIRCEEIALRPSYRRSV